MKTLVNKTTNQIKRVSDKEAIKITKNNNWKYCSKSLWKKNVRDANIETQ